MIAFEADLAGHIELALGRVNITPKVEDLEVLAGHLLAAAHEVEPPHAPLRELNHKALWGAGAVRLVARRCSLCRAGRNEEPGTLETDSPGPPRPELRHQCG